MKCSGTHFMTDELSSRVEGQLDRTMYKAPVIVISPCAYSTTLIGAYGHRTEIVPSLEHVLALQFTCHAILFVPCQSLPPSFSICVHRCDMPKLILTGYVMSNLHPSFYPFLYPCWNYIGRGSQFVGLETSIYACSTLLSTIFTFAFPLVLTQWGCTVLLRAAEGGSVPLVRALLEDYISSYQIVKVCVCV